MKILYLHQYFVTPEMSGGTRSFEMARRLVSAGHEVHVLTTRRESDRPAGTRWTVTQEAGINVHWITVPYHNRMSYPRRIWAFLTFAYHCARRAVQVGGDLVFATSTPLTIGLPGIFAAKYLRVPFVFEVRDLWPEAAIAIGALRNPLLRAAARKLESFCYRHAERIIALSPGMKEGIEQRGYPAQNITVVPNSCDRELFVTTKGEVRTFRKKYSWLGDRPLVVYTGTLGAANNAGFAVDLARHALNLSPDVRFLMVGDGKEEVQIRAHAERWGVLDKNFFLWKPVAKKMIPTILGAANVSLTLFRPLPVLQTCSPNKFFDSLAAGVPVAVNTRGWLEQLVQKEGVGIFLPPEDAETAARRLVAFLADRQAQAKATREALRTARQQFDRDKLFEAFHATILAAARAHDRRKPDAQNQAA